MLCFVHDYDTTTIKMSCLFMLSYNVNTNVRAIQYTNIKFIHSFMHRGLKWIL